MKIALTLEDNGPDGTVKGETFGDIAEDTPATRLAWAAMYMLATPSLIDLMAPNISIFRQRRLAQENAVVDPTPEPLER